MDINFMMRQVAVVSIILVYLSSYSSGGPIQANDTDCSSEKCEIRSGCKKIEVPDSCCPEYDCRCLWKGKHYRNLNAIGNHKGNMRDPCQTCLCHNGQMECITTNYCYIRTDCAPVHVPGKCCPSFDHCDPDLDNVNPILKMLVLIWYQIKKLELQYYFSPTIEGLEEASKIEPSELSGSGDGSGDPDFTTESPSEDSDYLTKPTYVDATNFLVTASKSIFGVDIDDIEEIKTHITEYYQQLKKEAKKFAHNIDKFTETQRKNIQKKIQQYITYAFNVNPYPQKFPRKTEKQDEINVTSLRHEKFVFRSLETSSGWRFEAAIFRRGPQTCFGEHKSSKKQSADS